MSHLCSTSSNSDGYHGSSHQLSTSVARICQDCHDTFHEGPFDGFGEFRHGAYQQMQPQERSPYYPPSSHPTHIWHTPPVSGPYQQPIIQPMITSHTSVIVGQAACLQRPYQLPPFTEPRLLQIEGDCRISNAATINFLSDVPRGPGSIHVHVYGNVYMEAPTKTKGPKSKKGKKGKKDKGTSTPIIRKLRKYQAKILPLKQRLPARLSLLRWTGYTVEPGRRLLIADHVVQPVAEKLCVRYFWERIKNGWAGARLSSTC